MSLKQFPPVGEASLVPLAFSFARFLGAGVGIDSVKSVSIALVSGADETPASRLYNAAEIDGQRVIQWIRYPAADATYKLQVVIVAADGREWPCTALLPCREI